MFKNFVEIKNDDDKVSKIIWTNTLFCIILLTIMWRQYAHYSTFPAAPIFNFLGSIPRQINYGLFIIIYALCFITMFNNTLIFLGSILLSFLALAFLDANNIYPFTLFHFSIFFVLLLFQKKIIDTNTLLNLCRWLVLGIYLSGALQKINPLFCNEVFDWLLTPVVSKVSLEHYILLRKTSILIPLWEFCTMFFLLFNTTRKAGLIMSIIMHVSIIFLFSPIYLNRFGPLFPFNLAIVFLNLILFKNYNGNLITDTLIGLKKWASVLVLAFSLGLPIAYFFGLGHAYLSYDLYSGKYRFTSFLFKQDYYKNLPIEMKSVSKKIKYKDFYILNLDSWMFYQTYGSIYREEFVLNYYKKYMKNFAKNKSNCVFMIRRNGKEEFELL